MLLVDVMPPADLQQAKDSVVERWLKKPGEAVRLHEPLLEINTDKATVEVASPAEGVLHEILKQSGETVLASDVLGHIAVGEGAVTPTQTKPAVLAPRTEPGAVKGREADLSPAVRQLVKQHSLDPARIKGSGRGGRVTVEDVQNHLKERSPEPATTVEMPARGRKVPHSPMRRRIAEHMVESLLKTAPHVTAVFEADFSTVAAHRKNHQEEYGKRGVRLTYTAYVVAAVVRALKAVPEVNSRWHDDGLELFDDCNVGVAAAVPGGLVVPVLHRAQNLDLLGTAKRLQELTEKARGGKLTAQDMQNGTFTITNHGVSGSLIATPIINQPQSAILGVGKVEKRLVIEEVDGADMMRIKPMAYVTLTIDHRALDGFQANTFLGQFVKALATVREDAG